MDTLRLTKTELRRQERRLRQLQSHLPTLQLRKMMLQLEATRAASQAQRLQQQRQETAQQVQGSVALLSDRQAYQIFTALDVEKVEKSQENVAGIDLPRFERVVFAAPRYALLDTPIWLESALHELRAFVIVGEQMRVAKERKQILQQEMREVSIRVNLFEKVLIPRTRQRMQRIEVFLSDRQLMAIAQAKTAKKRIGRLR